MPHGVEGDGETAAEEEDEVSGQLEPGNIQRKSIGIRSKENTSLPVTSIINFIYFGDVDPYTLKPPDPESALASIQIRIQGAK